MALFRLQTYFILFNCSIHSDALLYTCHNMGQLAFWYHVLFFTCAQLLFVSEVLLLRGQDYHCYTHPVCEAH